MGLGEPHRLHMASWGSLGAEGLLLLLGSGSAVVQLSPTACPQEEGEVANQLSLCSAFGSSGTVGTGSHARENAGTQSCTHSGSVGRAGKPACLLWAEPSATVFETPSADCSVRA